MSQNPVYLAVQSDIDRAIQHYEQQVRSQQLKALPGQAVSVNWTEILTKFIATVTTIVQAAAGSPGDKRQAVIDAALAFWNKAGKQWAASAIGHPFIFNTFIAPAIERQIPAIAGGVYDALVSVIGRFTGATAQGPQGSVGTPGPQGTPGGFIPY